MIDDIITLCLGCHLLSVNVAAGGPLICVGLEIATYKGSASASTVALRLARHVLAALFLGALLGVVIGALSWSDSYLAALKRMAPKFHTGGIEFIFSAVLLAVYSQLQPASCGISRKRLFVRCLAPLLAGTNLMYHFPLLFSVFLREVLAPTAEFAHINASAFRSLMMRGDVLPQAIHFWLATIAVSCTWLVALCPCSSAVGSEARPNRHERTGPGTAIVSESMRVWSARVALAFSLLQIPVGVWLFSCQPGSGQAALLGRDPLATAAFALSVVLALWLLHVLANLSAADWNVGLRRQVVVLMVVLVLLMTHVRRSIVNSTKLATTPSTGTAQSGVIHVQRNSDSARSSNQR